MKETLEIEGAMAEYRRLIGELERRQTHQQALWKSRDSATAAARHSREHITKMTVAMQQAEDKCFARGGSAEEMQAAKAALASAKEQSNAAAKAFELARDEYDDAERGLTECRRLLDRARAAVLDRGREAFESRFDRTANRLWADSLAIRRSCFISSLTRALGTADEAKREMEFAGSLALLHPKFDLIVRRQFRGKDGDLTIGTVVRVPGDLSIEEASHELSIGRCEVA